MHLPSELHYKIALTQVEGIGHAIGRKLIEKMGSAEAVFAASVAQLESIDKIGTLRAQSIVKAVPNINLEAQIEALHKNDIKILCISSPEYPQLLKNCADAPILLYYKGNAEVLNNKKIVAVVGTRKASLYGKKVVSQILEELAPYQPIIISGLALGIDALAHEEALKNGLPTFAVLAHGLQMVYPPQHQPLAKKMIENNGGLLTEYPFNTQPERQHFPERNRIVAGMAHCTLVIETGIQGGSIITAELSNGYKRDVFAIPGSVYDTKSAGCNKLIFENKAMLVSSGADIIKRMQWEGNTKPKKNLQTSLLLDLIDEEKLILNLLTEHKSLHYDELLNNLAFNPSLLSNYLLQLELKGIVSTLPGKNYTLT